MPPAPRRRPPGTRTPPPTRPDSARARVEARSKIALAYIHQLPRWLPFLVVLAVAVVAIFAPTPIDVAALVAIAAFLGWLGYLSWPALTPGGRLVRVAAVAVVVAAAVVRLQE